MSNTAYYTGEGVLNYAGVDYAYGAELPTDLPAETLQSMLANGKASATKPVSQERTEDGEVVALRAQLAAVTAERDAARDTATALEQQLAAANATVEDLTKQLMSGDAPARKGK